MANDAFDGETVTTWHGMGPGVLKEIPPVIPAEWDDAEQCEVSVWAWTDPADKRLVLRFTECVGKLRDDYVIAIPEGVGTHRFWQVEAALKEDDPR